MLFYTIGRSYLIELYHAELQSDQVRIVDGPESRRAYEQLVNLRTEIVRAGSSPRARRGGMMILAFRAPCWHGRHGIRIWIHGSAAHCPRDDRAGQHQELAGKHLRQGTLSRSRASTIAYPSCALLISPGAHCTSRCRRNARRNTWRLRRLRCRCCALRDAWIVQPGLVPELAGDLDGVDAGGLPPDAFVA